MVRRNNQLRHTPRFSAKAGQTQKYRQSRSAPKGSAPKSPRLTNSTPSMAASLAVVCFWPGSEIARSQPSFRVFYKMQRAVRFHSPRAARSRATCRAAFARATAPSCARYARTTARSRDATAAPSPSPAISSSRAARATVSSSNPSTRNPSSQSSSPWLALARRGAVATSERLSRLPSSPLVAPLVVVVLAGHS